MILKNINERNAKVKAKIALSFDDGRKDNYRMVNEILRPLNIPATINITTDYIMNRRTAPFPCDNPPMSKEDVISLSKLPFIEIAGHGKAHNNETSNLLQGANELKEWCGLKEIGIASPNSALSFDKAKKLKPLFLKHNISYIRTGDRIIKAGFVKRCIRKLNRYLHMQQAYAWFYHETMLNPPCDFEVCSVPVLKQNSFKEVKYLITSAASEHKSLILMFHSIVKKGEAFYKDTWSWDYDDFYKLCSFIKHCTQKNQIEACKTMELFK